MMSGICVLVVIWCIMAFEMGYWVLLLVFMYSSFSFSIFLVRVVVMVMLGLLVGMGVVLFM